MHVSCCEHNIKDVGLEVVYIDSWMSCKDTEHLQTRASCRSLYDDVESLETHRGRKCGRNEAGILCQPHWQVHSKQHASNLCINTTVSLLTVPGKIGSIILSRARANMAQPYNSRR